MPRNKHGLFQRGVSPTLEMRAKMSAGQLRRYGKLPNELDEFVAKIQKLRDEVQRALESTSKTNGHARLVGELAAPADPSEIQSFWPASHET